MPKSTNPVFYSGEDAQRFLDENEGASSIITNYPRPGCWTVTMSKPPAPNETLVDLFRPLHNQWSREEAEDRSLYEKWLMSLAQHRIAEEIANERGLDPASAAYFIDGFAGVHAKISNPRAEGLEDIFREGRRSKDSPDAQRRCRALKEQLRSSEGSTFEEWLHNIKHPFSPVRWREPMRG